MPYIKQEDRANLNPDYGAWENGDRPKTAGELNFTITCLIKAYFKTNGANYQAINDVVGALEGAKLEFTRRVTIPYEIKKCEDNGDVY